MEIFIFWIILTIVVAVIGDQRKIGSFWAFFISLLLSPLIGLIVVLSSKRKDTVEFEQKLLEKSNTETDYIDRLYKLKQLLDAGVIDQSTYDNERSKIEIKK